MRSILAAAIVGTLATAPASANVITGSEFYSGNWAGAAYKLPNGNFSHCAMSASYRNGDNLLFSVHESGVARMGLNNANWDLPEGFEIPVTIRVDNNNQFHGIAFSASSSHMLFEFDSIDRAINAVREGYNMIITAPDFRGVYSLLGTHAALQQTFDCAIENLNYRAAPVPAYRGLDMDYSNILNNVVLEIIRSTDAPRSRFLDESEGIANMPGAVHFQVGASRGFAAVVPLDGRVLNQMSGDLISARGSVCSGEFYSGSLGRVEGHEETAQVFAMCQEDSGMTRDDFSLVSLDGNNVVTIVLRTEVSGEIEQETNPAAYTSDAFLNAASYVVNVRE